MSLSAYSHSELNRWRSLCIRQQNDPQLGPLQYNVNKAFRCHQKGREEIYHALFRKLEKSALIWEKNAVIIYLCGYLWVKCFIENAIFKSFQAKKPEIFSLRDLFFLMMQMSVYRRGLIPRKLPCSKKFLVTRLRYSDTSANNVYFINIYIKCLHEHLPS